MRFDISHRTRYSYNSEVTSSHHVARFRPRDTNRQRCVFHEFFVDPEPHSMERRRDYFGNECCFFSLDSSYRTLDVHAHSVIEVDPLIAELGFSAPTCLDTLAALHSATPGSDAWTAREFAYASPLIPRNPAFAEYARPSFEAERPMLEAVLELTARIHADFVFDSKATTVSTPVTQVFESRRGVCQDFSQVQIACLRSLGFAARYVSGYIETLPAPGQTKLVGADASHAWISAYCPQLGWIDLDPTNNQRPNEQHITVAWGRDFTDISPLSGVFVSSGSHDLAVAVDVTRI